MFRVAHFAVYVAVYTILTLLFSYLIGSQLSVPVFIVFLFLGYAFSLWLEKRNTQ